jgi:hypothetical protein
MFRVDCTAEQVRKAETSADRLGRTGIAGAAYVHDPKCDNRPDALHDDISRVCSYYKSSCESSSCLQRRECYRGRPCVLKYKYHIWRVFEILKVRREKSAEDAVRFQGPTAAVPLDARPLLSPAACPSRIR